MSGPYLPEGLPPPFVDADGLSAPYWEGLKHERLRVQRCTQCGVLQFGPEWICHACLSFEVEWVDVEPHGRIYSWERVWHPVHPVLAGHGAYLAVVVELPGAGGLRMMGNLLGDAMQEVVIGDEVRGVFEHHEGYSLLQWEVAAKRS